MADNNTWTGEEVRAEELTQRYSGGREDDEPEEPHPLDKPFQRVDLGRIDEYADLMQELTGAPREFHQLIGLTVVAAAMHNANIPLSWAGPSGIRPNIYASIVAPSSFYRKSTALRGAHQVIDYDKMLNCVRMPVQFTEEGLIAKLATAPAGIVVRDEIGMLFASHKRQHLETVTQILTQVYDGDSFSKQLSSGETVVNKPYLNIIGATTPARFYGSVRSVDWDDGFLVRWLYVLPESEPNFEYRGTMMTNDHLRRITALQRWLLEVHNRPTTPFLFDNYDDLHNIWESWQRERLREAYASDAGERVAAIVARYNTYALKFAMILSVARGEDWGKISASTLRDATTLADNYKRYVLRLMREKDERGVDGGKVRRVFEVIHDWENLGPAGSGKYPTRREVGQYSRLAKDARDDAIEKLKEMGAIDEIKPDGRRTTLLRPMVERLPAKV